jgi:REP element-mobilizing transposase RayT
MGGVPRKLREEFPDAVHHAYARGVNRVVIFLDDEDRERYLALLGQAVERHGWHCLAFCLMHNHVHLLVKTPAADLGRGIQRLHGVYAQYFNRRHGRSGHLFQGRFGTKVMRTDAQLLLAARYIALNPVKAGLCREATQWRWSHHRAALNGSRPGWLDVPLLLEYFGVDGGDPLARYLDFVT